MTSKDADPPEELDDAALEDFRGGAWSILGSIPKPAVSEDGKPAAGSPGYEAPDITRSKLLRK